MAAAVSASLSSSDKWARFDALQKEISSLAKELKKDGSAPSRRRSAAPRDPDAPKREANAWVKQTQRVRAALSEHFAGNEEETKRSRHPVCVTQVSKMISEDRREALSLESVLEAQESWKANPPPVKPRASKSASSAVSVVSEAASEASAESAAPSEKKARKARAPMTAEAKAAMAAKRAATLAAKKGAAAPAPAAAPTEEPVVDLTPVACIRDFGSGRVSAERVIDDGVEHFLDGSGEQMGYLSSSGTLITDGPRPEWA